MAAVRLAAFDIDGTLTIDRSSSILCVEAIHALRKLEKHGVMVVLVSSNALPIVVGLKKYIGLSGPAIGETGALIYYNEVEIVATTNYSAKQAYEDVLKKYREQVYGSWQNMFRLHDYALRIRKQYTGKSREIYTMIKEYVENKYPYIKVGYSGYAIHLTPRDTGKGKALRQVIQKLGIKPEETMGVGDSIMDWEFIKETKIKVAVANADRELREKTDITTAKPSGYGVAEIIEKILNQL